MKRSTSIVISILCLQLMIALFLMLQCYDGNFFTANNDPLKLDTVLYSNNKNKNHLVIDHNHKNKLESNLNKCFVYSSECFNLFKLIKKKKDSILRLKPLDVIANDLIAEWDRKLFTEENLSITNIISNYSAYVRGKKMLILPNRINDLLIETISNNLGASKIVRLEYTRQKVFKKKHMEWLNLNDYLGYLLDFKSVEQFDNLASFSHIKQIKSIDLFKLAHCFIKPKGLFFIRTENNLTDVKPEEWSKLAEHSVLNTTNKIYVLKKKELC